jgi:hypothetical protein
MSRAITKITAKLGLAAVLLITGSSDQCNRHHKDGVPATVQNLTVPVSANLNC